MDKISEYLKNIYGFDSLSFFLLMIVLLLDAIGLVVQEDAMMYLCGAGYLPLLLCAFRVFSRNRVRRAEENDAFLDLIEPLFTPKEKSPGELTKEEKKLFKLFECPACKQKIRVPKHKGKIEISCPQCKQKFIRKT